MSEARLEGGVPVTGGWFVMNARAAFGEPRPGPAPDIFTVAHDQLVSPGR